MFKESKKYLRNIVRKILPRHLLANLNSTNLSSGQKIPGYIEWIEYSLIGHVNEFVDQNRLLESSFVKIMNKTFGTTRFNLLVKKYIADYLRTLFFLFGSFPYATPSHKLLILEDNPVNRFAYKKHMIKFAIPLNIRWVSQQSLAIRFFNIILRIPVTLYHSLKNGIKFSSKVKKHKIMREALYGLYGVNGYYFHDDFIVDGEKIKEEDLLLFSRGIPTTSFRLEGYLHAKSSPYVHFTLGALPIGFKQFILRIIPKYIVLSRYALFSISTSPNYSLFYSIFLYFIILALPYEKVFSHYRVNAELGHNYHTAMHIPESIICQNYAAKYYLMHWSDLSAATGIYLCSFLSCDKYLLWGKIHAVAKQDDNSIFYPTGYTFKKFIKGIKIDRQNILSEMGICAKGKIISFFDECFNYGDVLGVNGRMTPEHYVNFWNTALELARSQKDNTIIIKPKGIARHLNLPEELRSKFLSIKENLEKLPNAHIVDDRKWSFIETIGSSDIVVTQGMFSPSTIAIICGIEGLYLDEAKHNHPFRDSFKDVLTFDSPEGLLKMIQQILKGQAHPSAAVKDNILRDYDAYSDDNGIDRLRNILVGAQ